MTDSIDNSHDNSILKLQTLRAEYDTLLKQYQEAMITHNNVTNPCINYSPDKTNVSQLCYDKIWHDQGCISDVPPVNQKDSLNEIIKYIFGIANSNKAEDKMKCYGTPDVTIPSERKIIYPNQSDYVTISGKIWTGTGEDESKSANDTNECIAMCEASEKCSGATFNSSKKKCWTRTGDGTLANGTNDDYAVMKKNKYEIMNLKKLNGQILELNSRIINEINSINPKIDKFEKRNELNSKTINDYYDVLLVDKQNIEKELIEYYDVQTQYDTETLYVKQQHWMYNIYAILAMIIIAITAKKIYEGENNIFILVMFGIIWALYMLVIKIRKSG